MRKSKVFLLTFTKLQFVEDGGFTGGIKSDHKDSHLLLAELHFKESKKGKDRKHTWVFRPLFIGRQKWPLEKLRRISTDSLVGREDSKQSTHLSSTVPEPGTTMAILDLSSAYQAFKNLRKCHTHLGKFILLSMLSNAIGFYCVLWLSSMTKFVKIEQEATFVDEPTKAKLPS